MEEICTLYQQAAELATRGERVLSTDELTGVQALERAHPGLPLAPGKVERREFEYIRHGTLSFILNRDVVSGQVVAPSCGPTRTAADFRVKRQLELPVASLKTSDDGDETEAPTVCVTLPSFLCAWPPVEALRVRALQGGCRAASFPSSIVHGWLTLSLREEMHQVKRHVTLRSCWRQAAGTREAAAAGLPPRGSCPAPSDRE